MDELPCRFHGRNKEKETWEKKEAPAWERFNHYYKREKLEEWVPRLRVLTEQARATRVRFNTNYEDQGIVNARKLGVLLKEKA